MAILEASNLSSNQLVSIFNKLSENPIRRFADKSAAVKRVQKLLNEHKLQLSDTAVGEGVVQVTDVLFLIPQETPVRKRRISNAVYGEGEIIEVNTVSVVDEKTGKVMYNNPKRLGSRSHARFQIIIDAVSMTVGEYLDACHKLEGEVKARHKYRLDLTWDIEHGYIMFPNGADY